MVVNNVCCFLFPLLSYFFPFPVLRRFLIFFFLQSGNLIIKSLVVTSDNLRNEEVLEKMENVLLCISLVAIIVYFIAVSVLR